MEKYIFSDTCTQSTSPLFKNIAKPEFVFKEGISHSRVISQSLNDYISLYDVIEWAESKNDGYREAANDLISLFEMVIKPKIEIYQYHKGIRPRIIKSKFDLMQLLEFVKHHHGYDYGNYFSLSGIEENYDKNPISEMALNQKDFKALFLRRDYFNLILENYQIEPPEIEATTTETKQKQKIERLELEQENAQLTQQIAKLTAENESLKTNQGQRISQAIKDFFTLLCLKNYSNCPSRNNLFNTINADLKAYGIIINDISNNTFNRFLDEDIRLGNPPRSPFPTKKIK